MMIRSTAYATLVVTFALTLTFVLTRADTVSVQRAHGTDRQYLIVTVTPDSGSPQRVGGVCSIGATNTIATVVCRELRYQNTSWAHIESRTYESWSPLRYVMKDVQCIGNETRLGDCKYTLYSTCHYGKYVYIVCKPEFPMPALKVATERGTPRGTLVVTVNGQEGTVCKTGATNALAVVACRQMGWNTSLARIKKLVGTTSVTYLPILMNNVACTGQENSLDDCTYDTVNNCTHKQDVAIDCSTGFSAELSEKEVAAPVIVTVEIGTGGVSKGKLYVTVNQNRGLVCNDGATHDIAKVVCRELGFNTSWPRIYSRINSGVSVSRAPVLGIDEVRCTGNETSFAECSFSTTSNCVYTEILSVDCSDEEGPVSDVMITTDDEGYLYVTISATRGYIRLYGASSATLVAACQQFGFNTTTATTSLAEVDRQCWYYNVYCKGHETNLTECEFVTANECLESMVTKIHCTAGEAPPAPKVNISVAIAGGGPVGRLVVTVGKQSGNIGLKTPSNAVAVVICRELGWNTTMAHLRRVRWIYVTNRVLGDVHCTGSESKLEDCSYTVTSRRSPYYDVGIDCSPELSVLLYRKIRWKRVHVYVNGVKGYICREGATQAVADVICREVGKKPGSIIWEQPGWWKLPHLPYVMHDVYCTGQETTLANCTFTTFGECKISRPLQIKCGEGYRRKTSENQSIVAEPRAKRAVSSQPASKPPTITDLKPLGDIGRRKLLAIINGKVGSFCNNKWSPEHTRPIALVVCRELGEYTPRARLIQKTKPTGKFQTRAKIDYCLGNESRLADCSFLEDRSCRRYNEVRAACSPVPTFSIEGGGPRGRLIATVNLMPGTVCDKIANDALARVICRELGYNTDRARITHLFKRNRLRVMLDDAHCAGTEDKVANCGYEVPDPSCYREYSWSWYPYGSQDLEIDCSSVPAQITNVSIEGGGLKGRLLVTVNGKTGTVCNDRATHALAAVACRQLCLDTPIARITNVWAPSSLPIVANEVRCLGNETSLADCPFSVVDNCNHIEDVGVDCSPVPKVSVALDNHRKGRLLVTINGKTGTVCDDDATHAVAEVVCRELGFITNKPRVYTNITSTTLPVVMDEVQCTGNETSLAECRFTTTHNCRHLEDLAVRCPIIKEE